MRACANYPLSRGDARQAACLLSVGIAPLGRWLDQGRRRQESELGLGPTLLLQLLHSMLLIIGNRPSKWHGARHPDLG
jgi:hypothetical protein